MVIKLAEGKGEEVGGGYSPAILSSRLYGGSMEKMRRARTRDGKKFDPPRVGRWLMKMNEKFMAATIDGVLSGLPRIQFHVI